MKKMRQKQEQENVKAQTLTDSQKQEFNRKHGVHRRQKLINLSLQFSLRSNSPRRCNRSHGSKGNG